jgi:hypothetical protein
MAVGQTVGETVTITLLPESSSTYCNANVSDVRYSRKEKEMTRGKIYSTVRANLKLDRSSG